MPRPGPKPRALTEAELYWITTVRSDGRPRHAARRGRRWRGRALHHGPHRAEGPQPGGQRRVALTTGNNTWDRGLDVVVEGTAARVTDQDELRRIADAYLAKYGSAWEFEVGDGVFMHGGGSDAAVFRVEADKVLAFAKEPHAQTTYRPGR